MFTLALLYTIGAILGFLWLFGEVSTSTLSSFIHVLIILTVIVLLFKAHGGRRTA